MLLNRSQEELADAGHHNVCSIKTVEAIDARDALLGYSYMD
jgi:hypothetical protein